MTPEEIRAEASDRIAGADWDRTPTYAALGAWAEQSENTRNAFTANTYDWIVDALGDLLPTGAEEGGRCDAPCVGCECDASEPCSYSSDPNVARKLWGDSPRFRRYITDWKPVTE